MAYVSRRLTCGAKRLAHLHDAQGVGGSNPSRPTTLTNGNAGYLHVQVLVGMALVAIMVAKLCFHGSVPLRHLT